MLSGRFEKEEEKGVQYCHHCEAISFGFLSTPICNAKSLPVCGECHVSTMFICKNRRGKLEMPIPSITFPIFLAIQHDFLSLTIIWYSKL
jgi:hypothetical protein